MGSPFGSDSRVHTQLARIHLRVVADTSSTQKRLSLPPNNRSSPRRTAQSVQRTPPIHGNEGAEWFCVGNANRPHAQTDLSVSIHQGTWFGRQAGKVLVVSYQVEGGLSVAMSEVLCV